jgi:amino acid permease
LAFAALGWSAGIICLCIGAAVTFYSYNLISRVLEHHAQQGRRQLRFRDMANDILGQYALHLTALFYTVLLFIAGRS